jgi:flagellar FliL protein
MPPSPTSPVKGPEPAEKAAEKAPASSGGIKPWLPVIANVVLMPVLAYATVTFLIAPRLHSGAGAVVVNAKTGHASQPAAGGGEQKITAPLAGKVLVNVAGTMGTRYLVASVTLVGKNPELKTLVENNDAELRDAAAGALSVKTIADLEKPGVRNLIRTELISIFKKILGEAMVTDLYLTEFAIQ